MRLKGRIVVSFMVVMIIPLILINVAFFTIIKTRFSLIDTAGDEYNISIITSISNPIGYINKLIEEDYKELRAYLKNGQEHLDDSEYLDKFSQKIDNKYSYIYIIKGKQLIYGKNMELYDKIEYELYDYAIGSDESMGYFENNGFNVMVRHVGTLTDGSNLFFVTNISELETESKLAWGQLTASFVLIMLLTGLTLSYWLYTSVAKPIDSLRKSAKDIIKGDFNTEIKRHKRDEIGELADDFNNVREHINELLEDNISKKQNMKEMVVNISHDLKTPLTVIKGYVEGLREGVANTPEKQNKYLSIIYSKAVEMNSLIDALSAYAKLDMDGISYNFMELDINEHLTEGLDEIKTDLEMNNFEIYFHPCIEERVSVIADAAQFKRVINNLISNSKKYAAKDRKGRIDIRVGLMSEFVRVSVEDNGIGIPKEARVKVFERLYRVDESRNSKIGGSGLGLAIVKKIIEDHGGRVWAESNRGQGTKIVMLLRNADFISVREVEELRRQKGKINA